jgi:hypothetical protein
MIAAAGWPTVDPRGSRELFGCTYTPASDPTQKPKKHVLSPSLAANIPELRARLRLHRQRQRPYRRSIINEFYVLEHLSSPLQIIQNQLPVVFHSNKRTTEGENGLFCAHGVSVPQRTCAGNRRWA